MNRRYINNFSYEKNYILSNGYSRCRHEMFCRYSSSSEANFLLYNKKIQIYLDWVRYVKEFLEVFYIEDILR